ncbi:MAG TPA: hypothetical protein VHZ97_05660 [Pseudonocardiaceae bacterium]|jgi:hypothetical protein|nr:hypothetical protein [Pseudonocardiaceae bacterium]
MSAPDTEPRLVRLLLACYPADYRDRYGTEMLAVSRERAGAGRWPGLVDVADLLFGAVKVRLRRGGVAPAWRDALPIVGLLAPVVLIAGLADDLHEVAWFVYYGGVSGLPWRDAAGSAPVWLAWALVAGCAALGWRRVAAVLAWLSTAVMAIGLRTPAFPLILPTTEAWLLLALLSSVALASTRGVAVIGRRRWLLVLGAVALVLFARVLGHQFVFVELIAWMLLAVAGWRACRPDTAAGARAMALLAVPATVAALGSVATNLGPLNYYLFQVPWPILDGTLLVLSLLVPAVATLVLRRREARS